MQLARGMGVFQRFWARPAWSLATRRQGAGVPLMANPGVIAIKIHMVTMQISLPDALISFVDSQVEEGGYSNRNEYVCELIRKEQDRERLRGMILDGLASELNEKPLDKDYFNGLREKVRSYKK